MNLVDRKEKYDRVRNFLKNSEYKNGIVNAILYKKVNQNEIIDMFICFDDDKLFHTPNDDNSFVINPRISKTDKQVVIDFITSLDNGFEACYLSLEMHIVIHKVLEEYSELFKNQLDGIYHYLEYCKDTGINNTVLDNLTFYHNCDLFYWYYEVCFMGYEVITSTILNNNRLMLGFNENLGYMIAVLDKSTLILKEMKYHRYFDSAVNDYKNRYYDNCIKEYQGSDQKMNNDIKEHMFSLNLGNKNV